MKKIVRMLSAALAAALLLSLAGCGSADRKSTRLNSSHS